MAELQGKDPSAFPALPTVSSFLIFPSLELGFCQESRLFENVSVIKFEDRTISAFQIRDLCIFIDLLAHSFIHSEFNDLPAQIEPTD